MGTYAVADIHGCYYDWIQLKERIEKEDTNAKFILLGDIIDRGKYQLHMLSWDYSNITIDGKYQMIIGNHEDEKVQWYDNYLTPIISTYEFESRRFSLDEVEPDRYNFSTIFGDSDIGFGEFCKYIRWFRTLPYYKDIHVNGNRFILAHANIPYSIINSDYSLKNNLSDSEKDYIIWNRDISGFNKIPNTYLIHGHTPTISESAFPFGKCNKNELGKIVKTQNRYNIDCGIVFKSNYSNANLAALRLDDFKEFYLY